MRSSELDRVVTVCCDVDAAGGAATPLMLGIMDIDRPKVRPVVAGAGTGAGGSGSDVTEGARSIAVRSVTDDPSTGVIASRIGLSAP